MTRRSVNNRRMTASFKINRVSMLALALSGLTIYYLFFRGSQQRELISLKELLAVSIEAAKRGGIEVARVRKRADIGEKSKGKTLEGANNPITEGDTLSHAAMFYAISKTFPEIRVVSEEDGAGAPPASPAPSLQDNEVDSAISNDVLVPAFDIDVWIDPLDATQEYTENLVDYVTTMVCVAVRGVPVIGVIHKPFSNITAWGWAGINVVNPTLLKDISARGEYKKADLAKSRFIVSRSHAGNVHDAAEDAFGPGVHVTPAGGAGYKVWEVIKGNQDAYIHTTLIKKWDICPGNAILSALGGKLTTLSGSGINYSSLEGDEKNRGGVVATMHDHDTYVEKLRPTLKSHGVKL